MEGFENYREEVQWAQDQLNFYPDVCGFWDTEDGQEVIKIAKHCGLVPSSDNDSRKEGYLIAMHEELHDC